jgi:enoyl-CoA hydratase/carnithine racemase
MSQPRLAVTRHDTVAVVTFDRPERRNAFDLAMWAGLQAILEALSNDDALRCIVLRGAGTEAFSAGADISAFEAERGTRELEDRYAAQIHTSMQSIRLCRHPVVAMIMGYCLGGGAGIATMCDFRVGGESSRFGITARNLGIWYPYAEIDPIVQIAGTGVVAEILIEGRIFSGREAYEKGLLSRVVPDVEVEREAMALARRIAGGSPLAARFHKAAIRKLRGPLPISEAEDATVNDFVGTDDFQNAWRAFLAKERPVFTGH